MSVWLCACSRREIGRLPSPLLLDLPPDIRDASKCRWSGYPSGDGYQHPAASAITASLPDRRDRWGRSDESRVGKACVSTRRSLWLPVDLKTHKTQIQRHTTLNYNKQ